MRILIVYFSFTGNTEKVAMEIARLVAAKSEVDICRIEPVRNYSYMKWLILSFLPNYRTSIKPAITNVSNYSLVFLGTPKWTLSCPPVNEYISQLVGVKNRKFAIFMTYGGFDEERYLKSLINRLTKTGINVVGRLSIKRELVERGEYRALVQSFVQRILSKIST